MVHPKKSITFATAFREMPFRKGNAAIAQLVERDLAKVEVAFQVRVFHDVQVRVLFWALFIQNYFCWRGGGIGRRATLRG